MQGRRPRALWAVAAVGPVLVVAFLAATMASRQPWPGLQELAENLYPNVVFGTLMPLLGALILTRLPGHRVGLVFLACGLASGLTLAVYPYAQFGLTHHWPGALAAAWVSEWVWTLGFMPLVSLGVLLFPTGAPPGRRWWVFLWGDLASAALGFLAHAFHPGPLENHPAALNPLGVPLPQSVFSALGAVGFGLFVAGFVGAAASVVVRWIRGTSVERTQLRWFAASVVLLVLALLASVTGPLGDVVALVAIPALPISAAAAILRRHLYGIEVVVRRSLVYGGLTGLLLAGYAGVVALLETLLRGRAGSAATLAGTAAVAVAFAPVRAQLQAATDRLLYGQSNDPYTVLSGVGRRLEESGDAGNNALTEVAESVARSLRLPYVRVEVDGIPPLVATWGRDPGTALLASVTPLSFRGTVLGRLSVAPRSAVDPLRPSDVRLLDDIGRQVGVAAHAMLLSQALQRSREDLVAAREEERRRLRRDLHDGLGPTLAGIALGLDAVQRIAVGDPRRAAGLAIQLKFEVQTALADVRRLVEGLRPPALDELGLVGAVRRQAEALTERDPGLQVDVEVGAELPAGPANLPAAVEVAAFRIATEALNNVARHARARSCHVGFRLADDGDLLVEVEDDGVGLPPTPVDGVGLRAMRERALELGGTCLAVTMPLGGTRIEARLPAGVV